ncbi:hypothetical protein YGAWVPHU_CDS0105 [Salmonella phage SeKF_13]
MVDRLRKTYLPFEVSFEKPQEKPKKVTKKELARLAKEAGEKHFYADCKKHGKGVEHYSHKAKCCFCIGEYQKNYRKENKEYISKRSKKYYERNKEYVLNRSREYREENKEYISKRSKKYREANTEAIAERKRRYHVENREAIAERKRRYHEKNPEYSKRYYEENKEYILEQRKIYCEENREAILERRKKYRKDNAAYIFARSVLARLDSDKQEAFSGITKVEAEALCGYSQVEFILHIESTFKEGMSWENRSEWHIDHILPVAWFKEQGVTDIKVINALSNLRAEWASDNFSKGRNFLEEDLTEEEFLEIIMNEVDDGKDF